MDNRIPEVFKDYIRDIMPKNVEPTKIKNAFTLTREEAIDDLQTFRYLLENAYSGKEYWESTGFDFERAYDRIKTSINSNRFISKEDMFALYCESLQGIHDGHLSLVTFDNCINFGKKYKAYFADVLLEKKNDLYTVIVSKTSEVSVGDAFTQQQLRGKTFRTLSPKDTEHYLLGCRSWNAVDVLLIVHNDKDITVPVHPCKASNYINSDYGIFKRDTVQGYPVVHSSRFSEWDADIAEEFFKCGLELRNEDAVIWDLMNNGGGNSNYPKEFVRGLNEYSYWKLDCAELHSPAINQVLGENSDETPAKREWKYWLAGEREISKGKFSGTLYVLTNDAVISSGEGAINFAACVKDVVVIGQNTAGVGVFGDTLTYQLPFSDIRMRIPRKLFLGGAKEGEGYEPDYWIDSKDVLSELTRWLKSPEDYQFLR